MVDSALQELELAAVLLLVGGGFAATNIDNLLILTGLLGAAGRNRLGVMAGYVAGAAGVLGVTLLGASLGAGLEPRFVGYLGLVPLLLGLILLYRSIGRGGTRDRVESRAVSDNGGSGLAVAASTALLTVSNSGDSMALFLPLLAESKGEALRWEVVAWLSMILLWAALARLAVGHPGLCAALQRYSRYLVPLLMIAVGTYVLLDTGTDTLRIGMGSTEINR